MSNGIGNNKSVASLATIDNTIYAGTSGTYGIFLSTNNGINWAQTTFEHSVSALAALGNTIFAGAGILGVYLSTNSGTNWSQTSLIHYIYSLATSGDRIFAGTMHTGVYLSTNNGQNWMQIGLNNQNIWSLAISGSNPEDSGQVIFAGTYVNGVYLSTNNGQNWTQAGLNNKTVYSFAISGNNIFAGTLSGVYLSTNNGTNWAQTSLNNQYVYSLATLGNVIFAGTRDSGVYISTNNGIGWIQKNQGFSVIPSVYELLISNNFIFAGTDGQAGWRRQLSDIIGIQNISTEIPSAFSLEQNYPNPFNPSTKIRFSIPAVVSRPDKPGYTETHFRGNDRVFLKVFDILGKEVATLVNESLQPGTYETSFDASNLAGGIYFYRLQSDNYVESRKMLLIK